MHLFLPLLQQSSLATPLISELHTTLHTPTLLLLLSQTAESVMFRVRYDPEMGGSNPLVTSSLQILQKERERITKILYKLFQCKNGFPLSQS